MPVSARPTCRTDRLRGCASKGTKSGMALILALSSQVVRGTVGLSASVPALQAFGHEVWAMPTVLLSTRPGLGRVERWAPSPETLAGMLAALCADGCFARIDAVLTGYLPTPEIVAAAAEAVAGVKAANPYAIHLCDPVLGDAGRLYIAEGAAAAIRDRLVPLADVATPNRFELGWLTGCAMATPDAVVQAARQLGPAAVVVTSATESEASIGTLLVEAETVLSRPSPLVAAVPNGTGDVLAGLLLGAGLACKGAGSGGCDARTATVAPRPAWPAAFTCAMQRLERIVAASAGREAIDLAVLRPPSLECPDRSG
jgi:pyridoxine kinase